MPISQNPKECGWFYHAPAKKVIKERVDYPAPSNIPGIGFDEPGSLEPEQVKEMMFRETDSDYIRLAKMGGRKDLLAFTPDRYRTKQRDGRGYARNEWYYLEDNRIEDEEKKAQEEREWEFLLPEYMVHKAYRPSFEDPSTPTRNAAAPYHTENHSVMSDGKAATDKTVKIPEVRRPGFGVRNQKPPQALQKLPPREKAFKPKDSEHFENRRNSQKMVMPTETEDPTSMTKLLAGEYEREWYSKLADQGSRGSDRRVRSAKGLGVPESQKQASAGQRCEPQNASQRVRPQEEEKEMFKMARFKNIPSKLDTHQRPEIMASVK
ncbi:hypothetical protein PoB_001701700 [Plakobranchus ocellatus]|uniref:Nuclear protein MDM1 n=1 Tax=Plakobranchus ocellatus TaxID=259542 RepID=A0AAV3Z5H8_9GAST|nr:hypothetical protein PoB_001701700 [Plakobranchus ocellatus]